MRQSWDRARVIKVLAALKDAGITVPKMSRMAQANRSTIYRWIGGEVAPEYEKVYNLAYGIWRQHPGLARELVEASGYAWAEPTEQTAPPPLIDPKLEADIRKGADSEEEAEWLLARIRERRLEKLRTTDGKPAA